MANINIVDTKETANKDIPPEGDVHEREGVSDNTVNEVKGGRSEASQ